MDCSNIFTEDTDINIIKSWLIGCSDGQTYPINDRFLPRIKCLKFNFERIEEHWDNIIGDKYDYKIDDPNLEKVANDILNNINEFIENVNKDPQKFLGDGKKKYVVHTVIVNLITDFSFEDLMIVIFPATFLLIREINDFNETLYPIKRSYNVVDPMDMFNKTLEKINRS